MKKQNLLTAFDDILGPRVGDEIPKGYFTAEQIAADRKEPVSTLQHRLVKLANEKKLHRQKFRNDEGRAVWFYGVK